MNGNNRSSEKGTSGARTKDGDTSNACRVYRQTLVLNLRALMFIMAVL